MKKFYIKTLCITIFLSLYIAQGAFCADMNIAEDNPSTIQQGVDVSNFKNVKSVFKKKENKGEKTQKTKKVKKVKNKSKIQETELDNSTFSMFEEEENAIFSKEKEATPINTPVAKKKNQTKTKRFGLFDKVKKKKTKQIEPIESIQNEEVTQEIIKPTPETEIPTEETETFVNDTDIVYIKEVEIFGNNLLDTNYIKEQIKSKEGYQYVRSVVSNDLRILYNTGYFTQNIRALPIKIDDNNVKLRIILEENPPIEDFAIVGNNSISTSEILKILDQFKGKPQNILSINSAISEIQELYSTRGYILARVTKVSDDPDGYVYIKIDEGVIGDIIVEGNNKTKDFIIKRNIFLQPGSVYNENTMRSDILRLMGTQAFKDVQRELTQDETTGLYDVKIALEEQRTGKISLGVGIDSASGFFGSVGFGENNFRGLGQKLNLNLLAGTGILMNDSSVVEKANFQGELSFLEPMFKRENQSLALRGFARYYGSYQVPLAIEKRFGAEATIARKFTAFKNLSGSIGFGVESVDIKEGDGTAARIKYAQRGVDWSNRSKELDDGFFIKVTPALVYDTRDSMVNARRGVLARITLEENLGISGETFGKLHGMIRRFVPIGKKSSFVITAKAGGKIHGNMPDFAGYALGGPYTIRGFNISEVGVGDGYMLGSAEYRVPIPFIDRLTSNSFLNNLRLAAFVDAGTLFNKTIGTEVYDKPGYAISAGVGVRVFIPGLGPINLDYGIPLTNTAGTSRNHGFFTFGMGEMF
ncbi:BamA/TamA family outer membrane protein [bacterium]|nr:BamA/TamA family outer membrane protein [bacterium]MBQ9149394.1 BamA/TamA family outer membrane protein [bacterium]